MPDMWLYFFTAVIGMVILLIVEGMVHLGGRWKRLPGPAVLPLLGHWLTLHWQDPWVSGRGRGGDRLLASLLRWSEAYGGAFVLRSGWLARLLLGGPRVVVVLSDPDAVHGLLALREDTAQKSRRHYGWLERALHSSGSACCATAPTSAGWHRVRRSLLHAFSTEEVAQDFEVAKAQALLVARSALALGPGGVMDVGDAAARLSLDVMGLSKLEYDFEAVTSRGEVPLLRLLREVAAEVEAGRNRPAGRLAPWLDDGAARAQLSCRILQEFVEKELWADIEARGPPPPEDVTLAAQLARLRPPPPSPAAADAPAAAASLAAALPLERCLAELSSLLLMGTETTATALAAALYCLAANRPAQDRLVAELKREGVFDKPLGLTYDKLSQLPYLDCVVREALRLYPPQSCPATVRTIKRDVVLAGRRLPAGAEVWVDVFSMHRSPAHWRDPHVFNPSRWEAAAAVSAAAAAPHPPRSSLPYDGMCTVGPDPASDGGADSEAQQRRQQGDSGGSGGGGGPEKPAAAAAAVATEGSDSSASSEAVPLCSPLCFMPFGAGPRSCLGQRLAVAEVKAALVVLLSYLVLEPAGEGAEAREGLAGGGGMALRRGLFLTARGGVHCVVAPRKRG